MTEWLIVTVCLTLAGFNYFLARDLRSPAVIQALVWAVTLLVYVFYRDRFYPLQSETQLLLVGGVVAFSAGAAISLVTLQGLWRGQLIPAREHNHVSGLRYSVILGLCTALLGVAAFNVLESLRFGATGPTRDLAFNLRYLTAVEGTVPVTISLSSYALPVLNVLAGLLLIHFLKFRQRPILLPLALASAGALTMSVFSTGRGIVLFFIIEMLMILLMFSRNLRKRYILLGISAFVGIFYIGGAWLDKGVSGDVGFLENLEGLLSSMSLYLSGGTVALSQSLHTLTSANIGENVFRTFYAVAAALGFDVQPVRLVQDYTGTPTLTNVYTMYLPYVRDFGLAGGLLVQFVLGALHAAVYMRYRLTRSARSLLWVSMLTFALVTQSFTDGYTSLLTSWIIYLLLTTALIPLFFGAPRWRPARAAFSLLRRNEVP